MSIIIFAKGSNAKITEHFKMSEFQCKCSETHNSKTDTELVEMLEKLRAILNCLKITVNSGYRCPAHNKSVAGAGNSKHCDGIAADVVCFGQNGKPISANIVSCIAQDLGFGGIAKINENGAIHLDVRKGARYLGDETKNGYSSVTDDFYKYYGFTKAYPEPAGNIKNGDRGDGVKWLQEKLNIHGYTLDVDGIFGKQTLKAVKDFQTVRGLVIDGVVGVKTKENLRNMATIQLS